MNEHARAHKESQFAALERLKLELRGNVVHFDIMEAALE